MHKCVRRGIAFILILIIAASLGGISSLAAGSGMVGGTVTRDGNGVEDAAVSVRQDTAAIGIATDARLQEAASGYPLTDTSGKSDAGNTVSVSGYNAMAAVLTNTYAASPMTGDLPEIIDIEETLPPLEPSPSPSAVSSPVPSAPVQIPETPPKGPAPAATIEEPDVPLADAPATGESLLLYFLITLLMASAYGLALIALCEYRERISRKMK